MSRARELSRLGNPNIISADSDYNVGFGTLTPRAKGDFVGVVSATSFYGDGSTLSNIASAGIGTAVSDNKTSPLNHLYYTNQTLDVGVTTTVDVPASAALGYSQAAEIAVGNGADFIIADGDELIIDILGISTSGSPPLSGSGGRVRADNFTNRAATGAPDAPQGFKITATTESTNSITGALIVSGGVGIAKSLHVGGNVSVGGTLTYEDVTNVDVIGLATYRSGVQFGVAGVGGTITADGNTTITGIVTAAGFTGNVTGTATGLTGTPNITVGTVIGTAVTFSGISTFSGGVDYSGGATLREKINIVANKLSAAPNINLDDGMSHYFTTQETTTAIPNIISGVGINTELSTGDTASVTVITTAAAGGYSAKWKVDGVDTGITTSWVGGSVPTAGNASGLDTYALTLIKTGNAAYTIINNLVNSA